MPVGKNGLVMSIVDMLNRSKAKENIWQMYLIASDEKKPSSHLSPENSMLDN
jgi:hypothetical protein